MVGVLSVGRLLGSRNTGSFSPAALFAASEVGVWYDPSDFSTMYQDSAGTTPVTGLEQPVGLIRDKSGRGNHASQSTFASRPVLSARYNLLTQTEDFLTGWAQNGLVTTGMTNVTTAPNGTQTADQLVESDTTGTHIDYRSVSGSKADTISVAARANTRSVLTIGCNDNTSGNWSAAAFNLSAETAATAQSAGTFSGISSITPLGSGWYRCTLSVTSSGNAVGQIKFGVSDTATPTFGSWADYSYDGDGTSGIYIWGADLRVTNDGAGLPAYQRVAASTDYDTTGFPPYLKFDGVDDTLVGPAISNVISASAYEACVGARFNAVTTNSVNSWENQSLVADSAGYVGIGMARSTGAVGAYNFDGAQDEITVAMTPPATIVLQQRHSGGNLIVSTNGGAEVSTASGSTSALFGALQLLKAYSSGFTNGRLYGAIIRNTAFTDAERTNVRTWMNNVTKGY
jgi:hypothetical protein